MLISACHCLLFGILLLCRNLSIYGQSTNPKSIAVLEELYDSLGGQNWNWTEIPHLETNHNPGVPWNFTKSTTGVYLHDPCVPASAGLICYCHFEDNTACAIIGILLGGNSPRGTIPSSLFSIPYLEAFFVQSTNIYGSIPTEIGNATYLEYWFTFGTSMGGTIPNEIGNCKYLSDLHLGSGNSSYYGTIPESLGYLTSLGLLAIGSGHTGTFPESFCNATSLAEIYCANSLLTGTIPDCLGLHKNLYIVQFTNSLMTGTIPASLGQCKQLAMLDLHNSSFSGTLPAELANNTFKLQKIDLSYNSFHGNLPSEWGKMSSLVELGLGGNDLSGTLPSEWKNWKHMQSISIPENYLTGSLPSEWVALNRTLLQLNIWDNSMNFDLDSASWLTSMIALRSIDFGNNPLKPGKIPSWPRKMGSLTYLNLDNTSRIGTLIPEIFDIPQLLVLKLGDNALTGTIPSAIGKLTNLKQLVLSYNNFTGAFPKEIGALPLQLLLAQSNQLTDKQALQTLSNISTLTTLDLSKNAISGTIPGDIFSKLRKIAVFAIGSNCFTGSLPDNICNAVNLDTLALTGMTSGDACRDRIWEKTLLSSIFDGYLAKSLSGTLPQCIFQLPELKTLHIGGLGLSGTISNNITQSLIDLSAPFNALDGTLPPQLATNEKLSIIDLSHNRLTGNLNVFAHSNGKQKINTSINYLSGSIPQKLWRTDSINILQGNVFKCGANSKIPINDPESSSYSCGSDSYQYGLYFYIVGLCGTAVVAFVINSDSKVKSEFRLWLRLARAESELRAEGDHDTKVRSILQFNHHLHNMRWVSLKIALVYLAVLFLYLALSGDSSRLLEHCYLWTTTAAYMTGNTATICLLVTGFMLNCSIIYIMRNEHKHIEEDEISLRYSVVSSVSDAKSAIYIAKPLFRIFLFCTFIISVVIASNVLYLHVLFDGTQKEQLAFRLFFALFKLSWAYVVTPKLFYSEYLLFGLSQAEHMRFITKVFGLKIHFMFGMNILSLFFIPIIVQMCIDSACFYNMFIEGAKISIEFEYESCSLYFSGQCKGKKSYHADEWFLGAINFDSYHKSIIDLHPSFVYNYTCSAAIINAYTPLYAAVFTFQILIGLIGILEMRHDVYRDASDAMNAESFDDVTTNGSNSSSSSSSSSNNSNSNGTGNDSTSISASADSGSGNNVQIDNHDQQGLAYRLITMIIPIKQLYYPCHVRRDAYNKTNQNKNMPAGGAFPTDVKRCLEMGIEGQMGEVLMLLCFGVLSPLLGLIIATRISLGCYVSELVLGRFLVKELSVIEYYKTTIEKSASAKFRCLARRSVDDDLFLSDNALKIIMSEAAEAKEPWGAVAALNDLEAQCSKIPRSVFEMTGNVFLAVLSIVLAFIVNDLYNGQAGEQAYGSYPSILMCSFPVIVFFAMCIWSRSTSKVAAAAKELGINGTYDEEEGEKEGGGEVYAAKAKGVIEIELPSLRLWDTMRKMQMQEVLNAAKNKNDLAELEAEAEAEAEAGAEPYMDIIPEPCKDIIPKSSGIINRIE